jgi:hypothetical protein
LVIKQLQARGQSLSKIQQRIAGATDAMLRRFAGDRAAADLEMKADSAASPGTGQSVATGPFWKSRPVPVPTRSKTRDGSGECKGTEPERSKTVRSHEDMTSLQAIGLADHVMLLVDPARPVGRE